jgi:hypothetical protein
MSLRGSSGRNWPALGPRISSAVRALSLLVTPRPRSFCFRGMPGRQIALRFRVASHRRASLGGVRPLLSEPGLCSRGLTVPKPFAIASDDSRSMSRKNN